MSRKLALAVLPAVAATALTLSAGTANAATTHTYTVKPGDSLSLIAGKQIGDTSKWQALYAANRAVIGSNPDRIVPGQKLRLTTSASPTQPAPKPPAAPQPSSTATNWDKLAQCESSGNWAINTGNGFYGGLQFTLSTWREFGGTGMPHQKSRAEQIRIAEKVLRVQGPGAWPHCSYVAGMR